MRGYITQEERQRMQQMSASTDIKHAPPRVPPRIGFIK